MNMLQTAEKLKLLKTEKTYLKNQLDQTNAAIDLIEHDLIKAMTDDEVQNFVSRGTQYILTTKVCASPIVERKEELHNWMKQNGYESLVYETVKSNTLSAFAKEQMADNGELSEELSELLKIYEKVSIGMRKAVKK